MVSKNDFIPCTKKGNTYIFLHCLNRPVFLCGGELVADSGFIGSEGFPSFYKPNSRCTWRITVSHWVTVHPLLLPLLSLSLTLSVCCPGPRGERGYALLPHFWLWGWLTVPLRLSRCLQWSFQPGAETGSLLWNFPPRSSYFNYKHHDAGHGNWWRDTRPRLCSLFQWCQAIRRWYAVMLNLVHLQKIFPLNSKHFNVITCQ